MSSYVGGAKCAHDNSMHGAKSSSLATFRVKEGGVERFVVELIKMGVGLNMQG